MNEMHGARSSTHVASPHVVHIAPATLQLTHEHRARHARGITAQQTAHFHQRPRPRNMPTLLGFSREFDLKLSLQMIKLQVQQTPHRARTRKPAFRIFLPHKLRADLLNQIRPHQVSTATKHDAMNWSDPLKRVGMVGNFSPVGNRRSLSLISLI